MLSLQSMRSDTLWKRLAGQYDEGEAKAIVRMVLEVRFGLSWTDIVCGKADELKADELTALEAIMQRLEQGEPVQYVLGQAEFGGRTFHVEPGVLIPRPETQWMCDFVANSWGIVPREGSILDIGTGSGCIACTIAADLQNHPVEVVAWDISDTALRIASENARRLNVHVTFEKRDVLGEVRGTRCEVRGARYGVRGTGCEERWDIIVSNPPYVCEQEKASIGRHVLEHEPGLALFVPDDDPLLFYRHIGRYALNALKPEGYLLVEINSRFGKETSALMADLGFVGVRLFPDLYEKDRFVIAYKA